MAVMSRVKSEYFLAYMIAVFVDFVVAGVVIVFWGRGSGTEHVILYCMIYISI